MSTNMFSIMNIKKSYNKYHLSYCNILQKDVDERIEELCGYIENRDFSFCKFDMKQLKDNKNLFLTKDFLTLLFINTINLTIARIYAIKQQDRKNIVRQIQNIMRNDDFPYHIHKIDFTSFYENINRKEIIEQLKIEQRVDLYVIKYIEALFNNTVFDNIIGLPRGLSISATLSEIYMQSIDKKISQSQNVYYYARYVDDGLIFTYGDSTNFKVNLDEIISTKSISLNNKSTFNVPMNQINTSKNANISFEYLGYRFLTVVMGRSLRLKLTIADKKIKKIKKRINLSLLSYFKYGNDFSLLKKRISFIAGSTVIKKYGIVIKTGIKHDYSDITEETQLIELDKWFRNLLFSPYSRLFIRYKNQLTVRQKLKLLSISFHSNFHSDSIHDFLPIELLKIKEAWKHE